MSRYTSCGICGRPGKTAVCDTCKQAATYANPTYRANAGEMKRAARQGVLCCICSQPITDLADLSIEHLVPVREGGSHERSNLDYAHGRCNSRMMPTPEVLRYRPPDPSS